MNQGYVHRETIDHRGAGRSLLAHLVARGGPVTEGEWRERIRDGGVRLDGGLTDPGATLRAGQRLSWERPPWTEPDVPLCAAVLHEDPDLLAVAKPRGLPTLPGGGAFLEHTLLAVVRRRDPGASPMHRLGRFTSGLVLFARTSEARTAVQVLFREHRVRKVYRALCAGHPLPDAFEITAPIGEVPYPPTGTLHAADPGGRASRSRVRVLERRSDGSPCSLLEVEIATGRPHQIRIHLAHAGHPLLGDPLYGPGGIPLPGTTAVPGDPGYHLHAHRLELRHPRSGRELRLECPPPPILREGAHPAPPGPARSGEAPAGRGRTILPPDPDPETP
jgi:23S rRNA pseudouridine1911/1915/1917 synthase